MISRLRKIFTFAFMPFYADEPVSGGTPPTPTPNPPAARQPVSPEYAEDLRAEAASHRVKRNEAEQRAKAAEEAVTKAKEESEAKIKEAKTAADARIMRTELKAAAMAAGVIDADVLKLVDISKLSIDEKTGDVVGVKELIDQLKKDKPHFFGSGNTSNNKDGVPPPKPGEIPDVRKMTKEEYAAHRANMLKGSRGKR